MVESVTTKFRRAILRDVSLVIALSVARTAVRALRAMLRVVSSHPRGNSAASHLPLPGQPPLPLRLQSTPRVGGGSAFFVRLLTL